MAENLDIYVRIAADAARYAQGLQGASRETKRFADHARSELGNLKRELAQLGLQLGAVGFAAHGIKAASDFQAAMLDVEGNIKTTTMSTKELNAQLKEVRETAIDVHRAMPYSTKEVVGIQNTLLKAGVDLDSVKGAKGAAWSVAGLAAISETSPETTADLMARIGSQYALKGNQYGSAANELMKAEAASPGNLQEIMYTIKQFGSNAHLLGISVKDSAAMAAMATPLGMEAGTAINRFLEDSIGKTKQQQKALHTLGLGHLSKGKFQSDFFKDGKFIGIDKTLEMVRSHVGAIAKGLSVKDIVRADGTTVPMEDVAKGLDKKKHGDQAKALRLATKAWGEEGARFALLNAMSDKGHNFAGVRQQMETSLDIAARMEIKMRGFGQAANAAKGTLEATTAMAFDPFLSKLTRGAKLVNDLAGNAGKWLDTHPEQRSTVAWTGAGVGLAALIGPALWGMVKGMRKGKLTPVGALTGIGGEAMELGKGVAMGKTLQAAAGVTPVYVVNMPGTGIGGASASGALDAATGAAAAGAAGKLASKAKVGYAMARGLSLAEFVGAAGLGTSTALVAGAGAAGYGAGTLAYKAMEGTKAGDFLVDKIGGGIAKVLSLFGNEDAKKAVAITEHQKNVTQSLIEQVKRTDLGGTLQIQVATAPGTDARCKPR
ncbi:phage tail tape measure protein [Paludibacterium denitrificans]|uniref:Phage tail tape measure protein n=1 Tax=Paludibacterium denitrificans TaxID=2675226 RepID=A0A844G9G1_9NEIS|nr:phage tail tape measure protein [Paludibacterium denitrificans]MTD32412.1 phage tail tape measure protein [Paludibacterium denitrificans]